MQGHITRWQQRGWLRRYAKSRKVAGYIPDEVTEFFSPNLPNPSSRTMAMWFSQPLT
jgi:hypothetical protein